MEDEIDGEFKEIPNATRTALAFAKEANEGGARALLNRYAGRHSREWHKAVDKLRAMQARAKRTNRVQDQPKPVSPSWPSSPPDRIHAFAERTAAPNSRPSYRLRARIR